MLKPSITTEAGEYLENPSPGVILLEAFMAPLGMSQNALARAIHVSPRRINEVVQGRSSINADTDLRLVRYFAISEGFFLGLQNDYDLMQKKREIGAVLDQITPRAA